jgi:FMN reductase (NADPH)
LKETSHNIQELLRNHTSIRKYKEEEIPEKTLKNLIITAQHAASSSFVQAYSVIRIQDPKKIDEIATLSNNEPQMKSAPVVLLFCADIKRLEHACRMNGVDIKHDNVENFIVSVVDTALFAQNFVVAAEAQGYGICYIGGVRNNPEKISEIVGLPDKVFPVFGMTVGVPDENQYVKPRLPVEAVLHENTYNEDKYEELIPNYDQVMSEYYQKRLTNNKNTTWSISMSKFFQEYRRPHMKEFLESKGFHLR